MFETQPWPATMTTFDVAWAAGSLINGAGANPLTVTREERFQSTLWDKGEHKGKNEY